MDEAWPGATPAAIGEDRLQASDKSETQPPNRRPGRLANVGWGGSTNPALSLLRSWVDEANPAYDLLRSWVAEPHTAYDLPRLRFSDKIETDLRFPHHPPRTPHPPRRSPARPAHRPGFPPTDPTA